MDLRRCSPCITALALAFAASAQATTAIQYGLVPAVGPAAAGSQHALIKIQSGYYGVPSDVKHQCDAVPRFLDLANGKSAMTFKVGTGMSAGMGPLCGGADPARGIQKVLEAHYTCGTAAKLARGAEGQTVTLRCP